MKYFSKNRCHMLIAVAVIFFIVTITVVFLIVFRNTDKKQIGDTEKYNMLRTGDVICRTGNGIWSDIFRMSSARDDRFSHAGIVYVGEKGKITVIHSEADDFTGAGAVYEQSLKEFLHYGDAAVVYRLKQPHPQLESSAAASVAVRQYLSIPFDLKFNLDTKDSLYCTEMVYRFFADLTPAVHLKTKDFKGRLYVPVDSCNDPDFFDEILTLK